MTPAEALQLTDGLRDPRIKDWDVLVADAYFGRVWSGLGYRDWDLYCRCELHPARARLLRQRRQVIVHNLTEFGLSTRAIACALNIGTRTVIRDRRRINARIAASAAELPESWRKADAARDALGVKP